jgi:FdhD protein
VVSRRGADDLTARQSAPAGADVDKVAVEEPMEVRVNGASFAVIMRTPGADHDLAAGFLLAEDVIRGVDEIGAVDGGQDAVADACRNRIDVTVTGDAAARLAARLGERRQVMMTSACGMCGRRTIESLQARVQTVRGDWTVSAAVIQSLPDRLRAAQAAFEFTGGLHGAALFDRSGALQLVAEDVGRHNAVDKIAGRALLAGQHPLDTSILLVSGRTSFELVQKALLAGIPVLAAVSAPSSLAIELAAQANITLCGFVRGPRFNIYSHPHRIR